MSQSISRALLQSLSPSRFEAYLYAIGWKQVGEISAKFSIWHQGNSEVIIPKRQEFADYTNRIYDALLILADLNNSNVEELFKNVSASMADRLKIRVNTSESSKHTLTLDKGIELIDGAKRLIQSSARAVIEKKSSYLGKVDEQVIKYMEQVELGQTEAGSFIINILSPISASSQTNLNQTDLTYGKPYERKVLETLEKALSGLENSAIAFLENNRFEHFDNAIQFGVSKNLCEAVALIANCSPRDDIEIDISWSPLVERRASSRLLIKQKIIPAVHEAIEYYNSIQRHENVPIEGYVKDLHRESIQQDAGQIVISAFYDGSYKRVRVEVTADNHKIAIQAYEEKRKVMCVGTLFKKGRYWHLASPSNLALM